ncbi:MAG: DUF2254 domain-containing protein, partial [Chthoniobacterales bacterium]
RSSYWFLPSLLALGAILLSAFTLHIDTTLNPKWARDTAWIWAGGAEGARNVLATIASSTITVAGVVFSITIVTLTLASSQFGPRLLRNFMNDRGTQLVLGVFVATYLYCLLVLRAIRGTDQVTVVPFLSVTCGVVFAVASVGFLIFFIHHISTSIIAENVIARVAGDLRSNIDRLYPEKLGSPNESANREDKLPAQFEHDPRTIASEKSGFIQAIAMENLLQLAQEKELIIRLCRRPGQFIAAGDILAEVVPRAQGDDALADDILRNIFFGRDRTPTQDIEYSIDQLVEVAVRALSPGVNDPFTAITCIEWLGAALIQMAGREIPSRWRYDDEGKLRVITDATDFGGIANSALNQVRQYGCSSVAVTVRLLDVLGRIGPHLVRASDRAVLLAHARAIRDDGRAASPNDRDKRDIEDMFAGAEEAVMA